MLAIVAYNNLSLEPLLAIEGTKIKLGGRQAHTRSIGKLRRCEVVELRQKHCRHLYLLLVANTVARESTEKYRCLRQSHILKTLRIERNGYYTTVSRSNLRRRNLGCKVVGQVHDNRLYSLVGGVAYVYLLLRTLATVYVVKLDAVAIALYRANHKVVLATEVYYLPNHLSTHTQQQRLLVALGVNVDELVVATHCLRIVCYTHGELAVGRNHALRILHISAATTHTHIGNARGMVALVYHFKLGCCRRLVDCLSAVNNGVGCLYLLRIGSERHQEERGRYK